MCGLQLFEHLLVKALPNEGIHPTAQKPGGG